MHADIGEAQRGVRTHRELLNESIFFYNAMYHPRLGQERYGRLTAIDLPPFEDPEWSLPDMATTEAFRAHLRLDFLASMKAQTGSRATHLQWFMPVHVMVDLFSVANNIKKTPAYFIFKRPSDDLLSSLMDSGWDTKIMVGDDVIRCTVDHSSVIFKFHIGRSVLYSSFQFNRERLFNGCQWEMMDQAGDIEVVKILCDFGQSSSELEVGKTWTFSNIREEIKVAFGPDIPHEFTLWISSNGHTREKVCIINPQYV